MTLTHKPNTVLPSVVQGRKHAGQAGRQVRRGLIHLGILDPIFCRRLKNRAKNTVLTPALTPHLAVLTPAVLTPALTPHLAVLTPAVLTPNLVF